MLHHLPMDQEDFDGTVVLERLAESGSLDDFWDAVDADEIDAAKALMSAAGVDHDTIGIVAKKMRDGED